MTRDVLETAVDAAVTETHAALQTLWDSINHGQQKQLVKRSEIRALLDRYGVDTGL